MTLFLHFLGNPYIEINGKKLSFSLKKAESIVVYLALSGPATRNQLKALFWSDMENPQASANLRNALYIIRNTIPRYVDIERNTVSLKESSDDISALEKIIDPDFPIPCHITEEPLRNCRLEGSEEFDEWAAVTKQSIRKNIVAILRKRISNCYEKKLYEEMSNSLEVLLTIDPFDEDSVLELMEIYCNMGQPTKALIFFKEYSFKIENNMGIAPSERSRKYFRKIINNWSEHDDQSAKGEKFWCRKNELALMIGALTDSGGMNMAVYVHGEAGIGKTALINKAISILDTGGCLLLSSRSCPVGEGYPYSSWNSIMAQIGRTLETENDFPDINTQSVLSGIFPGFLGGKGLNYNADVALMTERNPIIISGMINDILRRIACKKKIIMIFEDIHWFDTQSIQLLTAFMSSVDLDLNIILSGRPESSRITLAMLQSLNPPSKWKIVPLKLDPLRNDEIINICRHSLSEGLLNQKGDEYFIRESEGIPLLLFEMLRAAEENPDSDLTNGLGGLIMARIGDLSELQQNVLSVLSVFAVGATPEQIAEATCREHHEVLLAGETLLFKGLLNEREEEGRVIWDFTHAKVRECIYESISLSKRQELHKKVAEVLNNIYSPQKWNPELSTMLCHHYMRSGQRAMELKQYLRELIFDITLNHDLFPVVSDKVLLSCSTPFSSREGTEQKITQAMVLLDEIRTDKNVDREELKRLEASCFELAGGYHISWGEYDKGTIFINEAINISKEFRLTDTHIHCLKHICYMHLQTENPVRLLSAAVEMIRLSHPENYRHYMATAVRFAGVSMFLSGEYEKAEKTFRHSIKLFENLKLTGKCYTLSILIAKCYIGEILQIKGDHKNALAYFTYATDTCENIGLYWGRSYFHTHAASLALDMNNITLLYRHIDKAASLFESCRGGRCGSMLYSIKAIADAERVDFVSSEKSIESAEIFLKHVSRKQWIATQYLAKAWLLSKSSKNKKTLQKKNKKFWGSPEALALESAAMYEGCGFKQRADWIKKRFNCKDQ
ncbi:MAG: AAA family ATPase [Synergistaceae bacterium]|nr:AAA family ATPase [Synergistaceae bacterium]